MNKRILFSFVLLFCLALGFLFLGLSAGSAEISAGELFRLLTRRSADETAAMILFGIRLPRTLAALLLGGALALSGYMLQTFFHNPIAGPFVLGISSGARLFVAAVLIGAARGAVFLNSAVMTAAAFLGALLSMMLVLLLSTKVKSMSLLIVCGVMIGYICTAATDILIHFADDSDIVNLRGWSIGSFSGMKSEALAVCAAVVGLSFFAVLFLSKPIGAYQLGESYAVDAGVNVTAVRVAMILFSSLLSGCVAAFAGPVSFVGIAVPFLVKSLMKTTKPLCMIPACFLGGGVFCILADILARTVVAPSELGISTVTAVLGAPVVLVIMLGRRRDNA